MVSTWTSRAGGQDALDERGDSVGDVLAVVEHEQGATGCQVIDELAVHGRPTVLPRDGDPEGHRDDGEDAVLIGGGGELEEPDAVGVVLEHSPRHFEREAGLAHTAYARERHETVRLQELSDLHQFVDASDESTQHDREVVAVPRFWPRPGSGEWGPVEVWLVEQDGFFEVADGVAGFDAELVAEDVAEVLVGAARRRPGVPARYRASIQWPQSRSR